ncbi:MAG: GNAT family N-acetyltransferase/peptidase C39 family protein [Gammaproteobacteria bacterium]|nr:GNAT family N-acetyltransferase/peptidase C39 family protein [Gammaproteobacteria bacterium]
MIRRASTADIDNLVELENVSFDSDRLSRRSFRYLLTKGNSVTLVDEHNGEIRAYAMLLFNTGTSLARLYSFAVSPEWRGKGVGLALLGAMEQEAVEHDCIALRLEIRKDNLAGIALYTKFGFREFGEHLDYYEDHMDALRMEKSLSSHLKPETERVPFYPQTLEFTCGPACLLMAMQALNPKQNVDRKEELRLWRESTTIFMTSGHGGCDPYGMALAAYNRGYSVEIFVSEKGALFTDSVRSEEKKEVMRLVHEDFIEKIRQLPIQLYNKALSINDIQEKFDRGGVPLVLISSYRMYKEKFPHWVAVTGFDDKFIYVHDPYINYDEEQSATDCINLPIPKKEFERMARYGKAGLKAILIIAKGNELGKGSV